MLKKTVNITQYNAQFWLLSAPNGYSMLLNKQMYQVVELLKYAESMEEACNMFNGLYECNVSQREFELFIESKFGTYSILEQEGHERTLDRIVEKMKGNVREWSARVNSWFL